MIENFIKLLRFFDRRELNIFYLLCLAFIATGLLNMVGIASVMPFITILSEPDIIQEQNLIRWSYLWLGFDNRPQEQFFIFTGMVVLVLLLSSILSNALCNYMIIRYAEGRALSISYRLLYGYLKRPYNWFISQNTSHLSEKIIRIPKVIIYELLVHGLKFVSGCVILTFLVSLTLYVQFKITLIGAIFIVTCYTVVYKICQTYLVLLGEHTLKMGKECQQYIHEPLRVIKDIKLMALEDAYSKRYYNSARQLARCSVTIDTLTTTPKFILEAAIFGGLMFLLVLLIVFYNEDLQSTLPIISMYIFVGYRLTPIFHNIFAAIAFFKFSSKSLDDLGVDLSLNNSIASSAKKVTVPVEFRESITLKKIIFYYPNTDKPIITDLSLSILANTHVGLVGKTGAGKSTVIDLLAGLLIPQHGALEIDNTVIDNNNRWAWQQKIGYVPQSIILLDSSMASNIAFGQVDDKIDMEKVIAVAKIAQIHEFITQKLENGYQSRVGEYGICLSGGQRQRIGIARALYQTPRFLILDEATNALDNVTEIALVNAINNFCKDQHTTILTVAHRLSTLQYCDQILLMDNGQINDVGNYQNFKNAGFRLSNLD